MIIEKTFYAVQCDNCGVINTDYDDVQYWNEECFALEIAQDSEWKIIDGKHFCNKCAENDNENELKIMTTQEKLQAVVEQIRKDIPRLMEFSEGCLVKSTIGDDYLKIVGNMSNSYVLYDGLGVHKIHKEDFKQYFSIIGHEPMLNDVLEWMGRFENFGIWLPDGDILKDVDSSNYYVEFETTTGESLADNSIKIDFSKPYLKDQSKELIDFLCNLINK